ncbi:MAG: NADP-dependent oxidoreductase [Bacteroidota bacterium]
MQNQQIKLAKRPFGLPTRDNWSIETNAVQEPAEGQFLVKVSHISLDPAMRGWMNAGKSYIAPVEVGAVMRAGAVGQIVQSKHEHFKEGDYVSGGFGVQAYAISNGKGVTKVNPNLAPLPTYLSTLGMPGMTAYFCLLEIGQPKAGETLVVSGAAGAVGSVVGQIGKIKGCKVVGIAGGEAKCNYIVNELGFDAAIDYKNEVVRERLKETCPDGVDIYFDNVGGEILDTVLTRLKRGARIPICGAISQYNTTTGIKGPANYLSLLVNRARMEGFVVFDYAHRYGEAAKEMAGWMQAEKLKSKEHIEEGLERFPEVLLQLFSGEKMGKLVLKV